MKKLLLLPVLMFLTMAEAKMCPYGMFMMWSPTTGYSCTAMVNNKSLLDPYGCYSHSNFNEDPTGLNLFYGASYKGGNSIWWAAPAQLYYPNVSYPGAWSYPGIQSNYYPGQGQVFAAKPNVYVDSTHESKAFEFKFSSHEKLSFLATTPPLIKNTLWKAKIVEKDKFEVEGIYYDYLFYDIRLSKEKMQFERGLCSTREGAIAWMLSDLKEMKYSALSVQDFEEHWRVKIPDYPFYCLYPQYNNELDRALPITINLEQTSFIRVLYVLVPFQKGPDIENPQQGVSFPYKDPAEMRPLTKIRRENMFREWGVAFLGTE